MSGGNMIVSAGGVVLREAQVLLVRVSDAKGRPVWCFPKGRLDNGETAAEAAVREVEEETGWRCRIDKQLACTEYWFQREGRRFRKTVVWFGMSPIEHSRTPDGEVEEVLWLPLDEARSKLTYPSDLGLLEQAIGGGAAPQ
ncbi:MAG: NUDIX domain-containing protein [Nitrospiraceae bacterium]|nr:NUDIX domain-containing protein [Nitrospiraceae bacterium]